MKKLIIILCAFAFISTPILTSCKKYADGPAFSLRTKKARLQGNWKIDSYTYNGEDKTSDMTTRLGADFVWNIEKGGSYKTTGILPDDGTWKFGEDKDDVYFQSSAANAKEESYRILRLANKQLWLKQVQTNGDIEILKLKQ